MSNYRDGFLQQGAPTGATDKQLTLTADNTVVSVRGVSLLRLNSDNATSTNRTFTLGAGDKMGHQLSIIFEAASNQAELVSTGNAKLAGGATWTASTQYDSIQLQWNGTYWVEQSRSSEFPANISSASDADLLIYNNSTSLWTNQAMSGDATISNAGALTIANSAVEEAMIATGAVSSTKSSLTDGFMKMARVSVAYTDLTGAGTGVAYVSGTTIPDNAIVYQAIIDVTTTFAGDGDDGSTISIGIEDQSVDTVAAIAISNGANPWDAGLHAAIQVGTAATAVKNTAARQVAVTWTAAGTDTTLTAGAMDVFVFYMVSSA